MKDALGWTFPFLSDLPASQSPRVGDDPVLFQQNRISLEVIRASLKQTAAELGPIIAQATGPVSHRRPSIY